MGQSILLSQPPAPGAWPPWRRAKARAVALRLGPSGRFEAPSEYDSASALAIDLGKEGTKGQAVETGSASCTIYLLEGLSEEFATLFGEHFQLHPSLFVDHERLVPQAGRQSNGEHGGIPFLPSTICGRDHVSLKYHEPMELSVRPTGFRNICDVSGRHIAVTRLNGEFSKVGIGRRKCTFWSKRADSGGWTCLIICDPPIRRLLTDYTGSSWIDVDTSPYNSGYLDFIPLSMQLQRRCGGPPRTSLLDDLLFYMQNHADHALSNTGGGPAADPRSLRVFVEKIVASHSLKLAEFLEENIDTVQWSLSRRGDLASFTVSAAEELWSDVQAWQRRVAEYRDDLEGTMLQLGIHPLDESLGTSHSAANVWAKTQTDSAADFQYLLRRYREIGRRTRALGDSISALGSLAGNRAAARSAERAGREARGVKALTIMGMVFLPLSFSASFFSMADAYLPGADMFWVYFAVSIPLVGVITLVYSVVEMGYISSDTGSIVAMRWSSAAAMASLKGKVWWRRRRGRLVDEGDGRIGTAV